MTTWTKLGHHDLGGSAGILSVDWSGLSSNYKHLKVLCWIKDASNGNTICFRFNDISSSTYGSRRSSDAWNEEATTNSTTFINTSMDSYQADNRVEMNIINPVGNYHKMCIGSVATHKGDVSGSEFYGRWASGSQITKITCKLEFAVNIASNSYMTVWGADDNTSSPIYPKLQDGTIFEEQDTGKIYIWKLSTNTWSEIT